MVEDDVSLVDALRYALQKSGYETETARSASEAKERMEHTAYDLLLLDVALPDGTGFEVCEGVRKAGNRVPVIFLTAADDEMSIVRGLDGGGDDYVTKPFKLGELCSRIRALLRRSGISAEEGQLLKSGDIVVDLRRGRVMRGDEALDLTSAEFRLLGLFIRNEGIVVTRNMILEELWDSGGSFVDDNTLSVYVRRLREKIEAEPSAPKHLVTVRGFGYRWNGEKD